MIGRAKKKELQEFAIDIRIQCMEQFKALGVGHVGGSLSCCDLMACLYGEILSIHSDEPKWEQRDRFIMSKGHAGPAMYAALALKGFFPREELLTLNRPETSLPSHTDMNKTPGVDMTTGSLGQGFSSGLGIAMGCRLKGIDNYTYILLGDGECDEGQVWECALFAPAKKLNRVIVFVDFNNRQLDGTIEEVLDLGNLCEKFISFGWQAIDVADGNDVVQICEAVEQAKADKGRPSLILLRTIKGKGCTFSEGDPLNHNMPVSEETAKQAIEELERVRENLTGTSA